MNRYAFVVLCSVTASLVAQQPASVFDVASIKPTRIDMPLESAEESAWDGFFARPLPTRQSRALQRTSDSRDRAHPACLRRMGPSGRRGAFMGPLGSLQR